MKYKIIIPVCVIIIMLLGSVYDKKVIISEYPNLCFCDWGCMFNFFKNIFKKDMSNFTIIENVQEHLIRNNHRWTGTVNDMNILIVSSLDGLVAIKNSCPHKGLSLLSGGLGVNNITCPFHSMTISLYDESLYVGDVIRHNGNFYLK